jgi:pyruvate-formate lyase-activating enzyme
VDQLLAHHEDRLRQAALAVEDGLSTAFEVAGALPWTRMERSFAELDLFNQTLATRETYAHLEVLAARCRVRRDVGDGGVVRFTPVG